MITDVSDSSTAPLPGRRRHFISRWLRRCLIGGGLIYLTLLVWLLLYETQLVYPGSKYPRGNWQPADFQFEEIEFVSADGTKLVGWFLPRPTTPKRVNISAPGDQDPRLSETILLCHGNAENSAQSAAYFGENLRRTFNADLFVFDYRGYGKSEGTPFEAGILDDAEAALAWLCDRTGKTASEIMLVGHSLGGGPACHLAGTQGCKLLILDRTFNSLAGAAQWNYPLFPVQYLMRNQYHSTMKIKKYQGPVVQSHGTTDELIPIVLARELFEAAPTNKKIFLAIPDMGHFDPFPTDYWSQLKNSVLAVLNPKQVR